MEDKDIVKITTSDEVTVVSFNEISIGTGVDVEAFSNQIIRLIESEKPAKMVVDFERVKFFSSQTLGLLLHIRNKLRAYGGDVVISGINPQLHRVFRITNIDKIFSFYEDIESAVKAINEARGAGRE